MASKSSSVSLPHCSFTLPFTCFQFPSMRFQSIASSSGWEDNPTRQHEPSSNGRPIVSHRIGRPHAPSRKSKWLSTRRNVRSNLGMAVAKSPLNLRREHGQVLSKFREQFPLFRVRRQITNGGTFGSVGAELMSFIGGLTVRLPEHYKYLPP